MDGTRKRRFSPNQARQFYYAKSRTVRFYKRFRITSAKKANRGLTRPSSILQYNS